MTGTKSICCLSNYFSLISLSLNTPVEYILVTLAVLLTLIPFLPTKLPFFQQAPTPLHDHTLLFVWFLFMTH